MDASLASHRLRRIWCLGAALGITALALGARAQPSLATAAPGDVAKLPAVGFSKLVLRLDSQARIAIAPDELRVYILETLRAGGFHAVGAENLVFGKDLSHTADYVLGGTVNEIECKEIRLWQLNCRMGIAWQMLDAQSEQIAYTATTRSVIMGVAQGGEQQASRALVLAALGSLTRRPYFRSLLLTANARPAQQPARVYPMAGFQRCPAAPIDMTRQAESALRATAVVQTVTGFGSGFLVSPDGLALTAAHVVRAGKPRVRTRDGVVHDARVIRVAPQLDAALLKVELPAPAPCLAINDEHKPVGTEIYAIGSPASEKLAFSLSRGLVSGVRDFDGVPFLQTDASISPGHSGGPLVDKQGRAAGIVSWKVVGAAVSGIAFAVPIEGALSALGVAPGVRTDAMLLNAPGIDPAADGARAAAYNDQADALPSLDPEQDRIDAENARQARIRAAQAAAEADWARQPTPTHIKVLRWGGLAVAAVGVGTIAYSQAMYDSSLVTHAEFERLRTINDVGWVTLALGGASFGLSYIIAPRMPPVTVGGGLREVTVGLQGGGLNVRGQF